MIRKLSSSRYEELKELGADLIEDYGLSYPFDPFEVAEQLAVTVVRHSHGLPAVAASPPTTDGYTTAIMGDSGPRFQVHLNDAAPPTRRRFTLSHELAHIWLDHLLAGEALTDDQTEGEANFLASYLLIPDVLAVRWLPRLTVSTIAEAFWVSGEAAQIAHGRVLRTLNRRSPWQPRDQRILNAATRRAFDARETA